MCIRDSALDKSIIEAGHGRLLTDNTTLAYNSMEGTDQYKEETVSVPGGIHYIAVNLVKAPSQDPTFLVKPYVHLDHN